MVLGEEQLGVSASGIHTGHLWASELPENFLVPSSVLIV